MQRSRATCGLAMASLVSVATIGVAGCSSTDALSNPADSPFLLGSITGIEQLSAVTGPDSLGNTPQYTVNGTDLGSMFQFDGKTWFVFGDTFGQRDGIIGGGGSFWRSNTMGWTTDSDPSNGITLNGMIVDDIGIAKELIPSKKVDNVEMTVIPTHGFVAKDTMYLHWMSVRHWAEPGEWEVNDAGLAKSVDKGQNWDVLTSPRWSGDGNFVQVAPAHVSANGTEWVYFWGITHGRFNGVSLMKVEESKVESADAYRYFAGIDTDGEPIWGADESDAKRVLDDTVGELSVTWSPYLSRWLMSYLKEGVGAVLREGITPWGPWGEPKTLVSATDVPGLYAPFMNESYIDDGGKTIYFGLSIWNPYNVFWYKAELVKK